MEISDSFDAVESLSDLNAENVDSGALLLDSEIVEWVEEADRLAREKEESAAAQGREEHKSREGRAGPHDGKAPSVAADRSQNIAKNSALSLDEIGVLAPSVKRRARHGARAIAVSPWQASAAPRTPAGAAGESVSSIASRLAAAGGALSAPPSPLNGFALKAREKKAWTPMGDMSRFSGVKPEDPIQTAGEEWAARLAEGRWQGLGKALSHMPELKRWVNAKGWGLAHWAAWNSPKQALRLLHKAGVDWEKANHGLETPLIVACRRARVEAVEALLEFGADAAKTGLYGQSAIELLSHAFAGGGEGQQVEDLVRVVTLLRDRGSRIALPTSTTLVGQDKTLPTRSLSARVLGDGVGRDMGDLAEALIEMGDRPSEEDLDWAHRRGSSVGVSRAKAALERALLQEESQMKNAENHRPRMLGETASAEPRRAAKRI